MSFDLTNKNISDTFQNLLQKTGSGNQLYDLVGNPIQDLTIAGALHAQSYIVSSSTIVFSSGSNAFGDSVDDKHQFIGQLYGAIGTGNAPVLRISGSISASEAAYFEEGIMVNRSQTAVTSQFKGNTDASLIIINASGNDKVGIGQAPNASHPKLSVLGSISASGGVSVGNGISSSGDLGFVVPNSNMYHFNEGDKAANFQISCAGGITMFVSGGSGGEVGIGTTSPSSKLQVVGGITSTHITASGDISASGTVFTHQIVGKGAAVSGNKIALGVADRIDLSPNGTTSLRLSSTKVTLNKDTSVAGHITASGNISGSNTSTLKVGGTGHFGGNTFVGSLTIGATDAQGFKISQGGAGSISLHQADDTGVSFLEVNGGDVELRTENFNNAVFVDDSTQRVGIGAATPDAKLAVAGNINTNSHITASGNISASGTIDANKFNIDGNQAITYNSGYRFGFQDNVPIQFGKNNNPIYLIGHTTASGNISSSGFVLGNTFKVDGDNLLASRHNSGLITIGNSSDNVKVLGTAINLNAPVTASSNITASGDITAQSGSFRNIEITHLSGSLKAYQARFYDDVTLGTTNPALQQQPKLFFAADHDRTSISEYNTNLRITANGNLELMPDDNMVYKPNGVQMAMFDNGDGVNASTMLLGLGTVTPSKTLTVEGDISASGKYYHNDKHEFVGDISASGMIFLSETGSAAQGNPGVGKGLLFVSSSGHVVFQSGSTTTVLGAGGGGGSVSGDTFATDLKIGRDSDNNIDFTTDNRIQFRVNNVNSEFAMFENLFRPGANGGAALGEVGKAFSDVVSLNANIQGNIAASGNITASGDLIVGGATSASVDGVTVKGDISASGNISIDGGISSSFDQQSVSYFGRAFIGSAPAASNVFADYATFGHIDNIQPASINGYAIYQSSTGQTCLNSNNSALTMYVEGDTKLQLSSSQVSCRKPFHIGNQTLANVRNPKALQVLGDISASGDIYGNEDGLTISSSTSTNTVFKINHPLTGSLMEVEATTDSGSLLVSGSILLKPNSLIPAVSASRLYNNDGSLEFNGIPIGPVQYETIKGAMNDAIGTQEIVLPFNNNFESTIASDEMGIMCPCSGSLKTLTVKHGTISGDTTYTFKAKYAPGGTSTITTIDTQAITLTNAQDVASFTVVWDDDAKVPPGAILFYTIQADGSTTTTSNYYFAAVIAWDYGTLATEDTIYDS